MTPDPPGPGRPDPAGPDAEDPARPDPEDPVGPDGEDPSGPPVVGGQPGAGVEPGGGAVGPPVPGMREVRGSVGDVVTEVRRRGVEPLVVGPVGGKRELIGSLGAGLGFPAWVGANWDALFDVLQNLYWLPDGPRVVVWRDPEAYRAAEPGSYALALRVLRDAAEASEQTPRPLTILLVR